VVLLTGRGTASQWHTQTRTGKSAVLRGQVFAPMHDVQTNRLTFPAFDPQSRQPSYKACAVRVTPA